MDGSAPTADATSDGEPAGAPPVRHPEPPPAEPSVYTAARPQAPRRSRGLPLALGVALLAGAGAAAWIYGWPRIQHWTRGREIPGGAPPRSERARGESAGSAPALVAEAERLLSQRGPAGALEAQRVFEKAVVLDPSNGAAVAGFARALALSAPTLDEAHFERGISVLSAAEKRSKDRDGVTLARAELLLARPTPAREAQARQLAEKVLERAEDPLRRARAHRVMGRSWQSTSSALAAKSLGEALALDPRLEEAWSERAAALEATGDLKGALADLQKRLELDPDHWQSVEARSRIYREVGQPELAGAEYAKILKKEPRHLRARLALAALRYQAEGRPKDAVRELRALAGTLSRHGPAEQAEILVHLSAAERAAGDERKAARAATNALAVAPEDGAAHLQLLLLAIDRREAAEAEPHLSGIAGKLGDPAVEKLLEGRVRMLQSRWEDAEKALRAAHDADRRRVDALLLAGICAAKARRRNDALQHLVEAARADPSRSLPRLGDPRFYFEPKQLLAGHGDALAQLAKRRDDGSAQVFDAVLRYHAGDTKGAAKRLRAALAVDEENALALAWRAVVALRTGDRRAARTLGAQAVAQDRLLGLGHYALGTALARGGETAPGRKALTEAVRLDPGLFGAEYELAAIDVRQGDAASARQRLVRLVTLDPSFLQAKELLFALETEAAREGPGPR
jgi:tetratricopeptide (TPR) repeat protein